MSRKVDRPLEIEIRAAGAGTVIQVHGSATMNEADKMRQVLEDLAARHVTPIVLDMTDLDFICSTGLGAIIDGHLKARPYEGQIRLVNPQPSVRELLETTRLTTLFPVFPSVETALAV